MLVWKTLFFLTTTLVFFPRAVSAHPLTPVALEVTQHSPTRFTLEWKTQGPLRLNGVSFSLDPGCHPDSGCVKERGDDPKADVPLLFHEPCAAPRVVPPSEDDNNDGVVRFQQDWSCSEHSLPQTLTAHKLTDGQTVIGRIHWKDNVARDILLSEFRPTIRLSDPGSPSAGFTAYLTDGLVHLLQGFDHVAFLLCLVVSFESLRKLLIATTAFTFGHMLALMLVVTWGLTVSSVWTEVLIASTLVVVAVDLRVSGSRCLTRASGWVMLPCIGFGCIHGLGFGTAMRWADLSGTHLIVALMGFNAGIEVGQLLVVIVVWMMLRPSALSLERAERSTLAVSNSPVSRLFTSLSPKKQHNGWKKLRYQWIPDVVGVYGATLAIMTMTR